MKLAVRMGVPMNEVALFFEYPRPSQPLYNEVDRITHFYRLTLVMQVNHETQQFEAVALKNFGQKMAQDTNGIVPAKELRNIFKIYYN